MPAGSLTTTISGRCSILAATIIVAGVGMAACTAISGTSPSNSSDTRLVPGNRAYFVRGTSASGSANSAAVTISGPGSFLLNAKFVFENSFMGPSRMGCTLWAGSGLDRSA